MHSVTQNDIAKALGVSQTTVALVVGRNNNHKGRAKLSEETVQRILDKAKELGYRPNRFAQVMRKGKSTQIGVIFSSTQLQVASERAYHITAAITARGYEPVFYDNTCHNKEMQGAFDMMLDAKVAGVVIASTGTALPPAVQVDRLPMPIIGISATDIGHHRLFRCDMKDGMLQIFRHLVDQGCQKIVLILPFCHPDQYGEWKWQQQMQADGVKAGAEECNGRFSVMQMCDYTQWVQEAQKHDGVTSAVTLCTGEEIDGENTRWQRHFGGVAVARTLLDSGAPLPDAIMCPNDDWAFGLACELIRSGIEVPRDIAITGFNDSAICEVFTVPFTSLRQPTQKICEMAIEMLSQEIAGEPSAYKNYDIKGELIIRDSSRFGATRDMLKGPLTGPSLKAQAHPTTSPV